MEGILFNGNHFSVPTGMYIPFTLLVGYCIFQTQKADVKRLGRYQWQCFLQFSQNYYLPIYLYSIRFNANQSMYHYSVLTGWYIPSTLLVDYYLFRTQQAYFCDNQPQINGSYVVAQLILITDNLPMLFFVMTINISTTAIVFQQGSTALPHNVLTIAYFEHKKLICDDQPQINGSVVVAQLILLSNNLPLQYSFFIATMWYWML